jgi:hypothetical protein
MITNNFNHVLTQKNDLPPLAFEERRVQIIFKIISIFGNDVFKDDLINVLCNAANDNLHSVGKSLTMLLNCINSSSKSVSKSNDIVK